jgi:hypothetical protein
MAFGSTLTVTVNAVAKVLNRINQDNYGSEYLLREALQEFRMKIRHSKESPKADGTVYDRHNVEFTHTIFATSTVPEYVRQSYIVVRNKYSDDLTQVGYGLAGFVDYVDNATVQGDLLTWQS